MRSSQINLRALIASTFCASKDDKRYYVLGVYTCVIDGERHYVSTDGHVLTKITESVGGGDSMSDSIIVPTSTVALLKKVAETVDPKKRLWKQAGFLSLCKEEERGGVHKYYFMFHVNGGQRVDFQPIDGPFPDYKRVLPAANAQGVREKISILPRQLDAVGRAYEAYTGQKGVELELRFTCNEAKGVLGISSYCTNFEACCMSTPEIKTHHKQSYGLEQDADTLS